MLSDHYRGGMTERLAVVIVTSDPASGRVEVVGKDAAVIQVAVSRTPVLFRWPKQGELWTIRRENGEWVLEEKVSDPDTKSLSSLAPGEAVVQTEKIWTPSGDYLIRNSELEDTVGELDIRLDALEADRNEWSKPQEKYGVGTTAAQDGVAPGTAAVQRSITTTHELYAAVTGDMRLTITPAKNCWWDVTAHAICITTDVAWVRVDFYIALTGSDVRGRTTSQNYLCTGHGSAGWLTGLPTSRWKLAAGVTYTAYPACIVSSGSGWTYYTGGGYFSIRSHVSGFY